MENKLSSKYNVDCRVVVEGGSEEMHQNWNKCIKCVDIKWDINPGDW